ncbi:MAG: M48 family metalloprotease [Chitinivibrionales bacterium]|nr:M48 family metalloprotease [Chitinivibrionales bacterium]
MRLPAFTLIAMTLSFWVRAGNKPGKIFTIDTEEIRSVVLFPPDVKVYEIATGGMHEYRSDWSRRSNRHVGKALAKRLRRRHYRVSTVADSSIGYEQCELQALMKLVCRNIKAHIYGEQVFFAKTLMHLWRKWQRSYPKLRRMNNAHVFRMLCLIAILIIALATVKVCARDAPTNVHLPSIYQMSRELEHRLLMSGMVVHDSALDAYLNTVIRSLVLPGDTIGPSLKVRVLKDPGINAFATPHGTVYVYAGILARMDNEAQLAALLGHEMTHITHQHAVKQRHNLKKKTGLLAGVRVGLSSVLGGFSNLFGNIITLSAITGYSRQLETEADRIGMRRMVRQGYRPVAFRDLFGILKDHLEEEDINEPYFFSTHPKILRRIRNYHSIIGDDTLQQYDGMVNDTLFLEKNASIIAMDAEMNIRAGRYSIAHKEILKCLYIDPYDTTAMLLQGDLYRKRNYEGDINNALEHYWAAVEYDTELARTHRELGLLYYQDANKEKYCTHLQKYLHLAPHAFDRELVEEILSKCASGE